MSAPVLTKEALDALASQVADDEVQRIIVRASIIRAALAHIDALEADSKRYHDERNEALSLNDYCAQTMRDLTESHAKMRSERDALKARVAVLAAALKALDDACDLEPDCAVCGSAGHEEHCPRRVMVPAALSAKTDAAGALNG